MGKYYVKYAFADWSYEEDRPVRYNGVEEYDDYKEAAYEFLSRRLDAEAPGYISWWEHADGYAKIYCGNRRIDEEVLKDRLIVDSWAKDELQINKGEEDYASLLEDVYQMTIEEIEREYPYELK